MRADHKSIINISLLLVAGGIILFSISHPFYWDNVVQISMPANWYYETGFSGFFIPVDIATGHPPLVGAYFAIIWKLLGRSLIITHLAMLPFVYGVLVQLHQLLRNLRFNNSAGIYVIMALFIIDTTILSQLSLITFEVIQLFFFLLSVNYLLTNKPRRLAISFTLLTMTSLRGSIMAGGIILFNLLYDYYIKKRRPLPGEYLKYIPGLVSLIAFLLLFKLHYGWIIHNTVSGRWETSGELASLGQIFRNSGIFIWRIIDYGRVGWVVFFLLFLFRITTRHKFHDDKLKTLFLITLTQFILLFPVTVTSQNAIGHRYLLPIIIPAMVLTLIYIFNYLRHKKVWLSLIALLLLTGHLWLYPLKISQGWDATTLHWRYFEVSEQMHNYVADNDIDKNSIATLFPNRSSRYLTHLDDNPDERYSGELFKDSVILYSNAFNADDELLEALFGEESVWRVKKEFVSGRIYMRLYSKD